MQIPRFTKLLGLLPRARTSVISDFLSPPYRSCRRAEVARAARPLPAPFARLMKLFWRNHWKMEHLPDTLKPMESAVNAQP